MEALENTARQDLTKVPGVFTMDAAAGDFGAQFLDETACRRWILTAIHRDRDIKCPECHMPLNEHAVRRFWEAKRIRCKSCGKFFTALTGTFLNGCHLDFRKIMLLAVLLHFRIRHDVIAGKLAISQETVRLWQKRFQANERLKEAARG